MIISICPISDKVCEHRICKECGYCNPQAIHDALKLIEDEEKIKLMESVK
jgi:aerobic-type carbon monoxide dehydrogenase small subunit (CoxS/CutS family)